MAVLHSMVVPSPSRMGFLLCTLVQPDVWGHFELAIWIVAPSPNSLNSMVVPSPSRMGFSHDTLVPLHVSAAWVGSSGQKLHLTVGWVGWSGQCSSSTSQQDGSIALNISHAKCLCKMGWLVWTEAPSSSRWVVGQYRMDWLV